MLFESLEGVIGVDTHRDTLAAAAVTAVGATLEHADAPASAEGYQQLLDFARTQVPGRRCWAIEGTSSYGAGLTAYLSEQGERVLEVCRPKRPPRRGARKSDALDAVRAAREILSSDRLTEPRSRGQREALRVLLSTRAGAVSARTAAINHLKALIVSAPENLRAELRGQTSDTQITYCAKLRDRPTQNLEHRTTIRAMRSTAHRIQALKAEANELERDIARLVDEIHPELAQLPGVGSLSAAQILISWSHHGRLRSEAAFASLAGAAPIPASSGLTNRHRLNRGGDRQLNRALHTIVLTRSRIDPATRAYITRRLAEGKTLREIKRCLKRIIARQLFRTLQQHHTPTTPATLDAT
ncbi:IS110 family transposase [Amycolatopsis sp. DSM 110486]|uniref:IS110 family transposase n=1 Tax=Amycolatopsis sp. DSM 110486 TaxID=2865832 RepID=UPI001C6A5163|nr:IS110 family transposase [Amycolatopsis sp. DSM 110486]QYN21254.1 IS110 family transposase [Amycolatopsis sp. DSM 110486]